VNEDQLRALVRDAVARRMAQESGDFAAPSTSPMMFSSHASHYRYALPDEGGACLIEPAVQCNHCGYCQSHGH
jgi:hypothetical protein